MSENRFRGVLPDKDGTLRQTTLETAIWSVGPHSEAICRHGENVG
jgi:hypothetical protein